MTSPYSRRDMLKGTAAMAAAAAVGHAALPRRAHAQAGRGARIDGLLKQAVDAKEVPGVVAMAATDKGVLYEGAFSLRALDGTAGMTPDTVFRIASMTKAIATVAAMQLVEQGKLKLEGPVPNIDPTLGSPTVLEGFDAAGKVASLRQPLVFDPGARWLYGINIEWTGRLIEATSGQTLEDYFRERIFGPLGMKDSGYVTSQEQRARQARLHTRQPDGSLAVQPLEAVPVKAEFWSAGGPLYSTARDYMVFLQMLLNDGRFNGTRILKPETVALMNQNHTGSIPCGVLKTAMPALSNDVNFFPGADIRWGLGYMMNLQAGPNGRSAGTFSWGGLYNTYYWLDPAKKVAGLIMTQILPFADPKAVKLYGQLEAAVYETLKSA